MTRLDRLGWAAGFTFLSYGTRIGIRTTDPAAISLLEEILPPGWRRSPVRTVDHMFSLVAGGPGKRKGTRRMWILYDAWVRMGRSREPEPLLEAAEGLVRLKVAEFSPTRVFVHAGAVGWKGRAILLPGRSYSGKSTLVSELVRAGATYYSDEYAVLDGHGRVHPFPAPLSMREPGGYEGVPTDPASLGRTGSTPLPVGLIVSTRYREGARWRPRSASPADGALELLANTVSARRDPETALTTLRAASASATVLRGTRGEAEPVAAALLEALA